MLHIPSVVALSPPRPLRWTVDCVAWAYAGPGVLICTPPRFLFFWFPESAPGWGSGFSCSHASRARPPHERPVAYVNYRSAIGDTMRITLNSLEVSRRHPPQIFLGGRPTKRKRSTGPRVLSKFSSSSQGMDSATRHNRDLRIPRLGTHLPCSER